MSPMPKQTCLRQRCKHRAWLAGFCKGHAKKEADSIFGASVRGRAGGCLGTDPKFWHGAQFECKGPYACCHLIRRGYLATRWLPENAVKMCASHHKWFDDNGIERRKMIKRFLGAALLRKLEAKAEGRDWRPELERILIGRAR